MTAATRDVQRTWASPSNSDEFDQIEAIASTKVFGGIAIGVDSNGWAAGLSIGGHDTFVGFATEQLDNSAGANGAKRVSIRRGRVFLPVTGATRANVGDTVYASDDNTFTLTQGSNIAIGSIDSCNTAGLPLVKLARS